MSESCVRITESVSAFRPPDDGDWKFWHDTGEVHVMPNLPRETEPELVEQIGKAILAIPGAAAALAATAEMNYERGEHAGRCQVEGKIRYVAGLIFPARGEGV